MKIFYLIMFILWICYLISQIFTIIRIYHETSWQFNNNLKFKISILGFNIGSIKCKTSEKTYIYGCILLTIIFSGYFLCITSIGTLIHHFLIH
jgi:hypothetical protein